MRLPGKYEFNNHLQVDVFYARDAAGTQFNFLNIICDATGFQVVSCLGQSQGPPASRRCFAPLPDYMVIMGRFATILAS